MKLRTSALLLTLLALAVLLGGCGLFAKSPPSVVSITVTDKVTEGTMAPTNSLTSFPVSTKLLYAAALVSNPQKGTKVEARWSFDEEGTGTFKTVDASDVTFPAAGKQNYVAFSLKAVTEFMAGTYKVEILLDGNPAKEMTFQITP